MFQPPFPSFKHESNYKCYKLCSMHYGCLVQINICSYINLKLNNIIKPNGNMGNYFRMILLEKCYYMMTIMLILDGLRNNVVLFVAEGRRDGEIKKWAYKKRSSGYKHYP